MLPHKNTNIGESLGVFNYFKNSLRMAPLPIIALIIYMSLRSTTFWDDFNMKSTAMWHVAYSGWYDVLLITSILVSIINRSIKFYAKDLLVFIVLVIIIALSFCSGKTIDIQHVIDSAIFLLRVFLSFSFAKGLTRRLGVKEAESVLIMLFIILSISALFVYQLQFGSFNRIFAAAMSAPSFAQVAVVVFLIAIVREYNKMALFSLVFLFLTFSRTSILLLIILFVIYSKTLPLKTTLRYFIAVVGVIAVAAFIVTNYTGDAFTFLISERTDMEGISTLNSRDVIWETAVKIMQDGDIPTFGIGLNGSPSLLKYINLDTVTDEGLVVAVPHFHSILIEYGFGLGISAIFLGVCLIRRIWQTLYHNCYPAFFIFAFFLICQSGDFTFYNPKELVIWSLMLGIAEGQWTVEHGEDSTQLDRILPSSSRIF
jgi:O-Antigen ligase